DIGTVVFPDADLKLFITADLDTRTDRRLAELQAAGKTATREEVSANLRERDHIDSTRADSPLRKAEDAIELDNTHLSMEAFITAGMAEVAKLSQVNEQ
ncbi:MAG: (d)CMP kinase, partial [Bacteroidota bacterium]